MSFISYLVLINGHTYGMFCPSKGLRQGDTLSLYLFLLCNEGFSNLIKKHLVEGSLHGIKVDPQGPAISHLFFADDSVLFSRAIVEECHFLIYCFTTYEATSEQKINFDKLGITFSPNATHSMRDNIQQCLNLHETRLHDKYLWLLTIIGRSKANHSKVIKERVWKKLQCWKGKLLSRAGKEVLIKAIAQVIPTYYIRCFKIPKKLVRELNSLMSNFW